MAKKYNAYDQVASEVIELVKKEKNAWESGLIFVTDKVGFNMRELIRTVRKNYWGVFDVPKDPITNRDKIWVPLTEATVENNVKSIDLDQKDLNFISKNPRGVITTEVVRSVVKHELDEIFFGELLDKTFRDMCIDGTAVWKIYESKKDGGKCLEIRNVDLLNFYIDPTAKSIQDTEAVIERNVMTVGEISSYSGWKNIDGLQGVNNLSKIDSDRMYSQSYANQVPMRDVYERWGLASEYWITGDKKDKDNLVNTHIVVSGLDKGQSPRVHLIEKYEGYKPYEEFWYRRVANRWYGKGPAEALSQLQEQINIIVNIRINRAILSQLGLFKLRKGSGITPQILRKLGSNGAIPVQDMNDIAQMPIADVPVSSYKDEEVINSWSQRVTNSFEVSTGENLPATTPATNAMLSDRATQSGFMLIKEGVGITLQRIFNRHIIPILFRTLKQKELRYIIGDDEKFKDFIDQLAYHFVMNKQDELKNDNIVLSEDDIMRLVDDVKTKFKTGKYIFTDMIKELKPEDYLTEVIITNETIDTAVMSDKLINAIKLAPEYKDSILKEVFSLWGLNMPQKTKTEPISNDQIIGGQTQTNNSQQMFLNSNNING